MIFVTVGTQKFSFNRLLKAIDKHKSDGLIVDEVFAQIGASDYYPQNYEYTTYLSKEEFDRKLSQSSVVVTHAGVGSIIASIKEKIPTIVVPRKKIFKEHVDDHQYQIAHAFEYKKLVYICDDLDRLPECIELVHKMQFDIYQSGNEKIVNIINSFIKEIE